jgi:hypothetical protein
MKTRKYIYENYEIVDIIDYGQMSFYDTDQETIGLIIRNNKMNIENMIKNEYIFTLDEDIFFYNTKERVRRLL